MRVEETNYQHSSFYSPIDGAVPNSILTGVDDAVDELVPRYKSVVVFVHLPEQVRQAGLLVVHEFEELRELNNVVTKSVLKIYTV